MIVPGLVNAHAHLEYAVYAGFGDGLPFVPWIGLHVRRKQALSLDDMIAIATVGAWESLRSGVTTVGDCSFVGATAEAAAEVGLRALVFLEVFLRNEPDTGTPMQTHFAESAAERDCLVDGTGDWTPLAELLVPPPGQTGIRLLAAHGLLSDRLSAAHCVHVDADEIALLAEHHVGVAHCPRSNGWLGCGIARIDELAAAGVDVAIATDSPASTPSLDLFEEMRTAIVAARARTQRPNALSVRGALEAATIGGARVLGLDSEIGTLSVGKQADLAVIDFAGSPVDPVEDPVAAVVLGGSPDRVAATLVAGELRYRRGVTTWPDSRNQARTASGRMLR